MDTTAFGTAVNNAYNSLDEKMLQAERKSDELRNDHLGALRKELSLINMQSMDQLVSSFATVAKAADVTFADIHSHWYTFGIGATGAKHSLEEFQAQYALLLSQPGKSSEASSLLHSKVQREAGILAAQKLLSNPGTTTHTQLGQNVDMAAIQAQNMLRTLGVGITKDEVAAQETLVGALRAQVGIEGQVAKLKKDNSDNATGATGKEFAAKAAEAAKESADHQQKMGELSIAAQRETDTASLAVHQASIAERLASDLSLADREYQIELTGNQARIAALNKGGDDYANQLRALNDKTEELTAQHAVTVATLQSKASQEQFARDLADLEQSERSQIDATLQGSAARLAAIDAALKTEESKNLQATNFYRELLNQRVQTARQSAQDEARVKAEAGAEEASNTEKMAELGLAAEQNNQALLNSMHRVTTAQMLAQALEASDREFQIKQAAMQAEALALDTSAKDYENKLKTIQDREKQLVQQHENDLTAIKTNATIQRNTSILNAENQLVSGLAQSATRSILGQQSWAAAFGNLGREVVSGMLQNAIMAIAMSDMRKPHQAAEAAREMFVAGTKLPFPMNLVAAPTMAAAAFASVMAYNSGTDMVPGVGRGDIVPAALTPGEGVVPGGVMDGLRNVARNGGFNGGGHTIHLSYRPTYHLNTVDQGGVRDMLHRHRAEFTEHFRNEVRKMNR